MNSKDAAVKNALRFYTEEMAKLAESQRRMKPAFLQKAHKQLKQASLNKLTEGGRQVDPQDIQKLASDMETMLKEFEKENDASFNDLRNPAIGIDLGTTYSCVGVFNNGGVEIIPNREQNSRLTPSFITYLPDGTEAYGNVAKQHSIPHPTRTIFDAKRMVGRKWDDPKFQKYITDKTWPFTVVNEGGIPKIKIDWKKRVPQEVSAKLLAQLCRHAEMYLQKPSGSITNVVITIPAYFTDAQRNATLEAGKSAGLNVLTILTEPIAAAIAHKFQRRETETRTALIYDLGGGTFDVAVVRVGPDDVTALAIGGDTDLGGRDIDNLLADHCAQEFERKEKINLRQKSAEFYSSMARLREQCENAKMTLSSATSHTIDISGIYKNKNLKVTITRSKLEELVTPLVRRTLDIVEDTLQSIKITNKDEIQDIIVVGGSTRIPLVKTMLSNHFNGRQVSERVDADEAVAYGATVQAAVLNGLSTQKGIDFFKITDVTPMSLGTEILGDRYSIIIPRNQPIPCELSGVYETVQDGQTSMKFTIYQGENPAASMNKELGCFTLEGFRAAPKGEEKADAIMKINSMGILEVTAVSKTSGRSRKITITEDRMRMDEETMARVGREVRLWNFINKQFYKRTF